MNIQASTRGYETWLGSRIDLVPADLAIKHEAMKAGLFPFFRATFYRWMQIWPEICPECVKSPEVLGIGDLHVENFGTWRDVEGRLIWGINDFDEAFKIPYTLDLVRLTASAYLAIAAGHLHLAKKDACAAILAGYRQGLAAGGEAYVLAERHGWLRAMVSGTLRDPAQFWYKLDALPTIGTPVPRSAERAIRGMLPDERLDARIVHRVAGLGSLGRQRYVGIAEFQGGKLAREAKALAPSACVWANSDRKARPGQRPRYGEILVQAVRAIDPGVKQKGKWLVRRLAPDCSRIELSSLTEERDESRLLHAMGFETANIHLGTPKQVKRISGDLRKRHHGWLNKASGNMVGALTRDWEEWRGSAKER